MRQPLLALTIVAAVAAPIAARAQSAAAVPEFFEVTGVAAGDTLNLRDRASAAGSVVAELSRGTVLRNLGCSGAAETLWCEVETSGGGLHGWAAGRFLREHADVTPVDAASATPTIPPTGELFCSLGGAAVQSCPFTVSRDEAGATEVVVTFPDGFERMLDFSAGEVNSPDPTDDVSAGRGDGKTIVEVNGVERIEVPDAVIPSD